MDSPNDPSDNSGRVINGSAIEMTPPNGVGAGVALRVGAAVPVGTGGIGVSVSVGGIGVSVSVDVLVGKGVTDGTGVKVAKGVKVNVGDGVTVFVAVGVVVTVGVVVGVGVLVGQFCDSESSNHALSMYKCAPPGQICPPIIRIS